VVHPDGQEISTSIAKLLAANDNTLDITVPENAVAGSIDTELRIYPNLMAHVLDAIRGIDSAYVQCPETIASRGYASLLVLELVKKAGQDNADPGNSQPTLAAASRKSVQTAQDELRGLQRSDGSFDYCYSYPKRSPISPTAYVLRFLNKSVDFAPMDGKAVENAATYLARQQRGSGAWLDYDLAQDKEVEDRNLTAVTARALAEVSASAKGPGHEETRRALTRVMNYLEDQIGSWQDAYLVGNYAIAAAVSGRDDYIVRAQQLLQDLAHLEGATTYWNLEANTSPFCNWGRSGRLETTALAVEALALIQARNPNPDTAGQINRGLQFLLSHKDHRGAWYGGLVTQNVLEATVAAMPSAPESAASPAAEATVMVNGQALPSIQLPPANAVVGPVTLEIAEHLHTGTNRVQILRPANDSVMNAAAFTSYYVPWKNSSATAEQNLQLGESRALRLKVAFDQNNPANGQIVHCRVETERIGFRGYGLLIAEVGLPPGADVDRESLDLTRAASVLSYEVHPDKVVFYLWPSPGGDKFEFQFRLRYRMEAATAPSILYDYYNPESHAIVQPVRFSVH
jgi:A-macroglobulin TED domain/A-macroglobulin receptor binding domain